MVQHFRGKAPRARLGHIIIDFVPLAPTLFVMPRPAVESFACGEATLVGVPLDHVRDRRVDVRRFRFSLR